MTISVGTRLGPYEIQSPLGAGGMGEVYKARDTRLERTVAIKVLPEHLSASPESRQRFEREAKTISQLSHPHICALYDVGREGETEFLVMEYLEGETLSDRLGRGALPLEQTLRYGIEIVDALDKAHRQGIVHRDLKPGNVMLTKSGVKLLDFGLAKLAAPNSGVMSGLSMMPTTPKGSNLTAEGTILGTLQYMAPEQLEGKEADARTDIFAFGAVLYEMATGRKAFSGTSQASLIGAILHKEPPPISTSEPMSPPALDRIAKTCLAKDPEDRFQTAHDVKLQLQWIAESGSVAGLPVPVATRRKSRDRVAWAVAVLASVVALGLAAFILIQRGEPTRMIRSTILPPEKSDFVFDGGPMALSPDGARLAFVAPTPDGKNQLWVRPLNGLSAQPLAGTEGATYPFWSPDSRLLGFFAGSKLKKIDASGGPSQVICDTQLGRGGTWNREGVIVFTPSTRDPLFRVSAAGGAPSPLTALDASKGEFSHRFPSFLPDGRHFLYLAQTAGVGQKDSDVIYAGSLDSKERKLVERVRSNGVYVPPTTKGREGHLLFVRDRTLLAQAFDTKDLRFEGDAVPVGESLTFLANYGFAVFTASQNGLLAYQTGGGGGLSKLAWFDRGGKELETVGEPADYGHPRLSHDGRRIAVDIVDPSTGFTDIWVIDLSRRTSTRLTFGPKDNSNPIWSPDDGRIVFASSRTGAPNLFVKSSAGAGNDEPFYMDETSTKVPSDWSLDGRFVAFHGISGATKSGWDLWTFSVSDKKPAVFLSTPATEVLGNFSPDGHWLAYVSDESGKQEVYVQSFPASGGKWQISTAGGREPVWSSDGKEIFYVTPQDPSNRLMAVDVKTSPGFEAGAPKVLFAVRLKSMLGRRYDVTRDGKRFLLNVAIGEVKSNPITLVQNWAAELKK
jgi:serine/threonine protein kinase